MGHSITIVVVVCVAFASVVPTSAAFRSDEVPSPADRTFTGEMQCYQDVTYRNVRFPAHGQNARNLRVNEAVSRYLDSNGSYDDAPITIRIARFHAEKVCIGTESLDGTTGVRLTFKQAVLENATVRGPNLLFERATADSISFDVMEDVGHRLISQFIENESGNETGGLSGSGGNVTDPSEQVPGDIGGGESDRQIPNSTDGIGNRTGAPGDSVDNTTDDVKDGVKNTTDDVKDGVNDGLDNTTDDVNDGVDNTTDGVKDGVKNTTNSVKDGVQNTTDGVTEGVKDTADGVTDGIKSTTDGLQDVVQNTSDGVNDGVQNTSDGVTDGVTQTVGGVKDGVTDATDGVTDGIRDTTTTETTTPDTTTGTKTTTETTTDGGIGLLDTTTTSNTTETNTATTDGDGSTTTDDGLLSKRFVEAKTA